jgi:predicted GIY-YIG superfamily endonuclease
MDPITVCPLIYVLKCEDDCYYVGITYNFNLRLAQHLNGSGANWTRLHKPVSVIEIIHEGATRSMETDVTKKYMELFGREKVRGGSWTRC